MHLLLSGQLTNQHIIFTFWNKPPLNYWTSIDHLLLDFEESQSGLSLDQQNMLEKSITNLAKNKNNKRQTCSFDVLKTLFHLLHLNIYMLLRCNFLSFFFFFNRWFYSQPVLSLEQQHCKICLQSTVPFHCTTAFTIHSQSRWLNYGVT